MPGGQISFADAARLVYEKTSPLSISGNYGRGATVLHKLGGRIGF